MRPGWGGPDLFARLVGLMSGVFAALAYLNVRTLGRQDEPEWRVVFYFALMSTLGGAVWMAGAGFVVLAAVSGIYGVTMSIGGDRDNGTLPYLFGTPANRFVMFFGRAFMHLLDGMLGAVIAFIWASCCGARPV